MSSVWGHKFWEEPQSPQQAVFSYKIKTKIKISKEQKEFLWCIFHINPTVELIFISLPFDVQFVTFLQLIYHFFTTLLQILFLTLSKNFVTVEIAKNSCPRSSIFYFFDYFYRKILSVAICKNIFVFWYSHVSVNFEFSIFVIIFHSKVNVRIWFNNSWFDFDYFMIRVFVFINYIL